MTKEFFEAEKVVEMVGVGIGVEDAGCDDVLLMWRFQPILAHKPTKRGGAWYHTSLIWAYCPKCKTFYNGGIYPQ